MVKEYTLGLDLGAASIGWALIDDKEKEVIAGVRIFPEGVDRDTKGSEVPKNVQRRTARGHRRQLARRARKRKQLKRLLLELGWFEGSDGTQHEIDALNPYELRASGLSDKLSLYEFARVLIHLNKRRGFLSNRKSDRAAKKSEQSELLASMNELEQEIANAGCSTIGEYLAKKYKANPFYRVRGKHTRRSMYETEFDLLWKKQAGYYPSILTDQLRSKVHKILFHQRKMYWPASSIGKCDFEPRHERCSRADRLSQKVRMYQEVNNLRILDPRFNERSLTSDEREIVLTELKQKESVKFDKLKSLLKLQDGYSFNYERGDRKSIGGMITDVLLAKVFGKEWYKKSEEEKDKIARFIINHEDDEAKVLSIAEHDWKLSEAAIQQLNKTFLPEGRARLSRKAMGKLLPYLEQGLPLMTVDGTPSAMNQAGYDRPDQRKAEVCHELPLPPFVANPIVRQGLFEVRKLVNSIIREHGKPARIHIELAREIKGNSVQRARITAEQRERQREREKIAADLGELDDNIKPNRENIIRYHLWKEQRETCIYSGKPISFAQLYNGDTQIDHILPYSRSLDDSWMNKVLAFRDENTNKGNQTPHEWLAGSQKEKYEQVLQRAASLPYPKRKKFSQKEAVLDEFVARQLVDTQYISREVARYVKSLGVDVVCSKGGKTAELRWMWGLDGILNKTGENIKSRDDHRHHAVDAIVVALTDRSRLQQLARRYSGGTLEEPWPSFREDVVKVVDKINVSHRPTRKVSGALHEETIYGKTDQEGFYVYRKPLESLNTNEVEKIRDHVVKQTVRRRLAEFGISTEGKAAKIPKEVWAKPLMMPVDKGKSASSISIKKVRLLKEDGSVIPLRKMAPVYVKPGSTHHICFFERIDAKGKPKKIAVFVSMLEVARRASKKELLVQRIHPDFPEARFLFSLSRNDMMVAKFKDKELLVRYVTGASTQGQLYFAEHTDARPSGTANKYVARAGTLVGNKVTVDVLGRIRWTND